MWPPISSKKPTFYFDDPRLHMTTAGRVLVWVMSWLALLLVTAAAFTFLVSDLRWLNGLGAFLVLFLIDYTLRFREADRLLIEMPSRGEVNLAPYVTPDAYSRIERAYDKSLFTKENFPLELAHELAGLPYIQNVLRRLDIAPEEFVQKTEELLVLSREESGQMSREDRRAQVDLVVKSAFVWAQSEKHGFIDVPDIFAGLFASGDEYVNRLLVLFNVTAGDAEKALIFAAARREFGWWRNLPPRLAGLMFGQNRARRHRVMNRAWTSRPTPVLDRYAQDLTDLAREGSTGFMVGHAEEYRRLVDTLSRSVNPNALLIGEAGIGLNTIVNHMAFNIAKDAVPPSLFDKRLVKLNLGTLVASGSEQELHARLQEIVREIQLAGNVILYLPELHNLVRTSGTAYLSAADALIPIISENLFPVIGATYPREFKQYIEPRSDFAASFELIRVNEITDDEAERLLAYESLLLERQTGVFITFGAVKRSVELGKKYFHTKFLPDSAEDLLKSAVVRAQKSPTKLLGPDEVVAAAEEKVNIPMHQADAAEAKKLVNLEAVIHEKFIDQEEAVKAVADALREYRSGLSRKGGPIASFLFVGPTGVGKTELSKILAKIQFGSEKAMLRYDMTEYQDKQSFYRFIGSPDGAVTGVLTQAVSEHPYSLVLLDEFEKAFPDILNLFLQVLDDGRLTDNLGRTVDFTNTIVIATSNAHSDIINSSLAKGESMASIAEYLKSRLTDVYKPELLNRFSKVIVFRDLAPQHVRKIAELNLAELANRTAEQGIHLVFEPAAIDLVAKLGYEPAFGARPLRRVIDDRIRAPLAKKILEGRVERGGGMKVIAAEGEFQFVAVSDYVNQPASDARS
jgi:ATP-dependent Clp protease ATP-binding subunit ClpC